MASVLYCLGDVLESSIVSDAQQVLLCGKLMKVKPVLEGLHVIVFGQTQLQVISSMEQLKDLKIGQEQLSEQALDLQLDQLLGDSSLDLSEKAESAADQSFVLHPGQITWVSVLGVAYAWCPAHTWQIEQISVAGETSFSGLSATSAISEQQEQQQESASKLERAGESRKSSTDSFNELGKVREGQTQSAGRGLFARCMIRRGERVLLEQPLVCLQTPSNQRECFTCRNCLCFIGTMQDHVEMVAGLPRSSKGGSLELAKPVACVQNCGQNYCSEACRDHHFNYKGHRWLCVGLIPDAKAKTHPLMKFKMHALQTNEIFLLVADVVCKVLYRFLHGSSTSSNKNNTSVTSDSKSSSKSVLQDREREAYTPFHAFKQEVWWQCCVVPDDVKKEKNGGKKFLASLQELCSKSSHLLSLAVPHPRETDFLFTRDFFGKVIGMFEQNNVGVRLASPLHKYVLKCIEDSSVKEKAFLDRNRPVIREIVRSYEEQKEHGDDCDSCGGGEGDEGEEEVGTQEQNQLNINVNRLEKEEKGEDEKAIDRYILEALQPLVLEQKADEFVPTPVNEVFTPLDGTALFTWICMMNHSCEPNCWVQYCGGETTPLLCEVLALRDIAPDEELFQSYIDKSLPAEARQAALRDYGFVCRCTRCVRENLSR